jgi:hypothetical protein
VGISAETVLVSLETVAVAAETGSVSGDTLTVPAVTLSVSAETVVGTAETVTVSGGMRRIPPELPSGPQDAGRVSPVAFAAASGIWYCRSVL